MVRLKDLIADALVRGVKVALSEPLGWEPPTGYLDSGVASTVVKIVLGGGGGVVADHVWL